MSAPPASAPVPPPHHYPVLSEADALDFFARLFRGKHHIPSKIRDDRGAWSVSYYVGPVGMATFDSDELTRLVFFAHERCVRAWITPSGPGRLRISIAARDRTVPSIMQTHPTLDEAVEKFRSDDHGNWGRTLARRST